MLAERGEGDPDRHDVDELRARFRTLPDPGAAGERSRQARSARGGLMAIGALVAVACLFAILGRLNNGTGAGVWTVAYSVGLGAAVPGVELARRGRTRWALMATIMGAVGATLGNALL
ncbi:hypothetical protein SZN_22241 [Streptomyces zinciresistens K42]|uniref:Uncharacterized protein n=2 Tax=Streptomyces TaxID=1883 RepID=G2GG14_9ACTN|nr:hypothetical protein SZN_22241 [Streptomyces zinciresistens K42]